MLPIFLLKKVLIIHKARHKDVKRAGKKIRKDIPSLVRRCAKHSRIKGYEEEIREFWINVVSPKTMIFPLPY